MQEAEMKNQKESETPEKSCEIISNNTNEDSSDEAEPISIQDEIIMTPPFDENSGQPEEEFNPEAVVEMESSQNNQFNKLSSQKNIEEQDDVCFNYASILKFIKQGNTFYAIGECEGFSGLGIYYRKDIFIPNFLHYNLRSKETPALQRTFKFYHKVFLP